jgi:hypothetical protein
MLDPLALNSILSTEVTRIVRACHETMDNMVTRYFKGLHLWVPFLCPERFRRDMIEHESMSTAEFSMLLLSVCLITYDPLQHGPLPIDHDALYVHTMTLLTQIQLLRRPSIHLIQAGLFISIYEYAHGRPDSALASIDTCTRMAYKVGIHQKPERPGWSESWNTWWAIRILERVFYCETTLTDLTLMTSAPDAADLLPHEVGDSKCEDRTKSCYPVSPTNRAGIGCFGRVAQASYLLDRVIQTIKATSHANPISSFIVLDDELRGLLSVTMNTCLGKRGGHCGAVGISIRSAFHFPVAGYELTLDRALFMLHQHQLRLDTASIGSECHQHYSQAALDTAAQMVLDIARSHWVIHGADIDIIPPVCNYVVRHTLEYLYNNRYGDSSAWFQDSDTLRQSLDKLNRRWPVKAGLFSEHWNR